MQYEKEIILKDGAKCLLRGAGEADAAEVLRTFDLTHAETDYLLTYPEENSFAVQEEAEFLKARSESKNAIEIAAFVDGRIAGTAGFEPVGDQEKASPPRRLRHRHRESLLGARHREGSYACVHRMCEARGLSANRAGSRSGERIRCPAV